MAEAFPPYGFLVEALHNCDQYLHHDRHYRKVLDSGPPFRSHPNRRQGIPSEPSLRLRYLEIRPSTHRRSCQGNMDYPNGHNELDL